MWKQLRNLLMFLFTFYILVWALLEFSGTLMVKNPPANAGDIKDRSSTHRSGRSPVGGHSNPLLYSCLEIPLDRGAWLATDHRVAKSRTWLKWLSMHTCTWALLNFEFYKKS